MDDENRNRFMLDTSIIIPIAIAGGIALLIVVSLYCCRHFVQNKRILRTVPRPLDGGMDQERDRGNVNVRRSAGQRGRVSDLAAIQSQFLPWALERQGYYQRHGNSAQRDHYPPPSTHSRANYNSTQVSTAHQLLWLLPVMK